MGFNLIYWTHIVGSNLERCGNLVDMARFGKYIDNTDWVVNPLRCIPRGRPFATGPVEGPQAPETGSKRPPETDIVCEDFLPRQYCIYFTSCSKIVFCLCILRKQMLTASVATGDRRK